MISLQRPDNATLQTFMQRVSATEFSYEAIGATQVPQAPAGYVIDRNRKQIGNSVEDFEVARKAIQNLEHLDLGWVTGAMKEEELRAGSLIVIQAEWFILHFLAACKVVYTIDETHDVVKRFGFAYGTLADHAESGEELFLLEFNQETKRLDYEIYAFSRPNAWYTKLGYPLVRRAQKRFARDSIATMLRIVSNSSKVTNASQD